MIRRAVRAIDLALRVAFRIRSPDDPRALFRLRRARAVRPLPLADGVVPAGAPVLELHFWNERLPRLARARTDLEFGARLGRAGIDGLRAVARALDRDPSLAETRAVGASIAVLSPLAAPGARSVLSRLGFTLLPARRATAARRAADGLWAALLLRAFQPEARGPSRGVPLEIWMSAAALRARYGAQRAPRSRPGGARTDGARAPVIGRGEGRDVGAPHPPTHPS